MVLANLLILAPEKESRLVTITENGEIPYIVVDGVKLLENELLAKVNGFFDITEDWVDFKSLGYTQVENHPLMFYFGVIIPEPTTLKQGEWTSLDSVFNNLDIAISGKLGELILRSL